MAFVDVRVGIEVDGWQYHGKFKRGFHRDREKRNLLVINGWSLMSFTAKQILQDPGAVLDMIDMALRQRGVSATKGRYA